jgi:nucleoside-diphosphate-sugar epimerase
MHHHVVIGAGPVGSGVANLLAAQGTPVTLLSRRGTGAEHPLITLASVDASDVEALTRHTTDAAAIYNCANPPYHRWATEWPPIHQAIMTAAGRTGAVVAMMDNLYAFGPSSAMPMREANRMLATGTKGVTRAKMAADLLQAHADGHLRGTLARAADFFGPEVVGSAFGERVVPRVLSGKKVSMLGHLDVPHSTSYMPDVIRTLVTIAADERAWGKPWQVPNAPAVSQRETVDALARAAGTTVKLSAIPKVALSALGVFVPMMRELKETWYQFEQPWITDSALTETTFALTATPLAEAATATVEWWRAR